MVSLIPLPSRVSDNHVDDARSAALDLFRPFRGPQMPAVNVSPMTGVIAAAVNAALVIFSTVRRSLICRLMSLTGVAISRSIIARRA